MERPGFQAVLAQMVESDSSLMSVSMLRNKKLSFKELARN